MCVGVRGVEFKTQTQRTSPPRGGPLAFQRELAERELGYLDA